MTPQSYAPYRTKLISPEALRRLNVLRPWIPVCHTILHWSVILAAWSIVALWPNLWTVAGASVVVGVNLYGLYIVAHDGLHRRLFPTERANDLWNDLFLVGPFGAITRLNRANHMTHHWITCHSADPDRHKYTHDDKEPVLPFMLFLSGFISIIPTATNIFLGRKRNQRPDARPISHEGYRIRDLVILASWQIGVMVGLTFAIGWWAYPALWLAPIYLFTYRSDLTRVFCEHSMLVDDAAADQSMRLVTYTSFWLERLFFAPHNMNFHMTHHLWPSIPYYNLPEADRLIRCSELVANGDDRLVWRCSYIGYLASYMLWRLRDGNAVAVQQ
jgi:fatty acid desaturase